jgi:hypothetical protein
MPNDRYKRKTDAKRDMRKRYNHAGRIGVTTRNMIYVYSSANKWNIIKGIYYQSNIWMRKRDKGSRRVHKMDINADHGFKVLMVKHT